MKNAISDLLAQAVAPTGANTLTGQNMGGANAWLWQPQSANTSYTDFAPWDVQDRWNFASENTGNGIGTEVEKYLREIGYAGALPYGDSQQNTQERRRAEIANWIAAGSNGPIEGAGFDDAGMPIGFEQGFDYSNAATTPGQDYAELQRFMQERGLSLQNGVNQLPGASQATHIQRLLGSDKNPLAVDAYNDRYNSFDRFSDATKLFIAAVGGAAAAGVGAAPGATSALPSALPATTAGGSAALPSGLTGLGSSITGSLPMVPSLGAVGGSSVAALPAGLTGLGSSITGSLSAVPGLGGAGAGAAGLGGSALADAALGASMESGSFLGSSGSLTSAGGGGLAGIGSLGEIAVTAPELMMGSAPSFGSGLGGGGSWLDALKDGAGTIADLVGGAENLGAIAGGIAGAADSGDVKGPTTTQQIDPRMAQYLYGSGVGDPNSLLGAAQQHWQQNKSGMNADMTAGLQQLRDLYGSPEYSQGYEQMRSTGQGLLGAGMAGNPYASGGQMPQFGAVAQQGQQQMQQHHPFLSGLLSAGPQQARRFGG